MKEKISFHFHQQTVLDKVQVMQQENERAYTILSVEPLGNKALTDYLTDVRKIDIEIARVYCQEIYYRDGKRTDVLCRKF